MHDRIDTGGSNFPYRMAFRLQKTPAAARAAVFFFLQQKTLRFLVDFSVILSIPDRDISCRIRRGLLYLQ